MNKPAEMLSDAKVVLFDLDGTVYYGDAPIQAAVETIDWCRSEGKDIFFLTNNSASTRIAICEKLNAMGVACDVEEVVTGGYAAGLLLRHLGIDGVYTSGTEGISDELRAMGIDSVAADEARDLVVGFDPSFDYGKLTRAARVAMRSDVFVACNKERYYRGEGAEIFPGCGGMVAAVEWCSGREADYVAGKPEPLLLQNICRTYGYEPNDMLVVGDTYESDIVMAERFGCQSVLVSDERCDGVVCVSSIGELIGAAA